MMHGLPAVIIAVNHSAIAAFCIAVLLGELGGGL
jgi:hypothetical protein